MNDTGQIVIFYLPMLLPRCKVSQFSIVPIIRHPHLWTNMKDLAVIDDDTAVVDHIFVDDRPEDIGQSQG